MVKDELEDLGLDGDNITMILKKKGVSVDWILVVWLRIETRGWIM
jgi:hypothetical protein